MSHVSDSRFLVLHGLKLKGFAETEGLAAGIGAKPASVAQTLVMLQTEGLILYREGRISGFALTVAGRSMHADLLAADVETSAQQALLHRNYESFLPLNAELLAVCTAWQVVDLEKNILNDHSDAAYDIGVIDRLMGINARVVPILGELADALARYGAYKKRFDLSLVKLRKGDREFFAKPIIDSYHTVWMELHEDLLKSLNIDRASEGA